MGCGSSANSRFVVCSKRIHVQPTSSAGPLNPTQKLLSDLVKTQSAFLVPEAEDNIQRITRVVHTSEQYGTVHQGLQSSVALMGGVMIHQLPITGSSGKQPQENVSELQSVTSGEHIS